MTACCLQVGVQAEGDDLNIVRNPQQPHIVKSDDTKLGLLRLMVQSKAIATIACLPSLNQRIT